MNTKNLSTGVLLVNVGTPDAPTPKSVRRYLKEFLWDKRVVDIFWFFRVVLLYGVILPLRSKSSAKLYQKIWSKEGSPLLIWSRKCAQKLAQKLGNRYTVQIAMGYGNPSIQHGIDTLLQKKANHLVIVPLFPQYAVSTTGSVIEHTTKLLNKKWQIPTYSIVKPFFQNPYFIQAFKELIDTNRKETKPDFILFSYHGLPVRHLKKAAKEAVDSHCQYGFCLDPAVKPRDDTVKSQDDTQKSCCEVFNSDNYFCYRAQCFETTKLIAKACELPPKQFAVSFQSRFGKSEWTAPDTQTVLSALYQKGIRILSVVCPGFVADCLETVEEIEIRLKEQWLKLGGTDLVLIKSLNDNHTWILCLEEIIRENNRDHEI